jgi:nitrate reductase NapE
MATKLAALEGSRSLAVSMNVEKRRELAVFVFLTLVLAPLIAVLVVAGYGFMVWMYQMIAGPPTL